MIKMISGTTRVGAHTYSPSSGAFSEDPKIEDRLVKLGVAKYVGRAPGGSIVDVELNPDGDILGEDDKSSKSGVATPTGDTDADKEGDNPPIGEGNAESNDGALLKPEYNSETGFDDLKEMYRACGLSFKVGMSRIDLIAALDDYYGTDDNPPALGAEDPV